MNFSWVKHCRNFIPRRNALNRSKRDSNGSKLAVITTYFNPQNYTNIKYNYLLFAREIEKHCDLFPIELSFNGDFFINHKNVVQIRGNPQNILWQKEKLLNIALENIPEDYNNIAWLDCDILFHDPKWVIELNQKLNDYKVVHLFSEAFREDQDGNIFLKSRSIIKNISESKKLQCNLLDGIPGFAWGIRRECIDKIKFFDTQILGGADFFMCAAFLGVKKSTIFKQVSPSWPSSYKNWYKKAYKEIGRSVSHLSGNITHLYHGNFNNRAYRSRYQMLTELEFDPKRDIEPAENGVWKINNPKVSKGIEAYFESRQEDDNIIRIQDYFDRIYLLNLDRRTDRLDKMSTKLNSLGIPFQRFSAVDGTKLHNEFLDSLYNRSENKIENSHALACLRSHCEIVKEAKNKGYKRILILEDDALFIKDMEIHFQKLRKIKNWKLLYLGASQYKWDLEFLQNDFYLSKNCLGTFAYAVDSSIYERLIELCSSEYDAIDRILVKIQKEFYGQCYTFFPNICTADVSDSDIRPPRNQSSHQKLMKWNENIYF